jgi:hypothetical protein
MNLFEKPHHKEECRCEVCWQWMIETKQGLVEENARLQKQLEEVSNGSMFTVPCGKRVD